MRYRIIWLAAAAAIFAALTACGEKDESGEKPVVIEVDRWYPKAVEFPEAKDDVVRKAILRDLNIDLRLKFSTGRSEQWRAKLASRVASGDMPDMIYFFNMMDYRTARAQGYIIPLNDVLRPDKLPDNLSYIDNRLLQSIADDDGKYYGIPGRLGPMLEGMFIRADWLEKLGLQPPATVDEFAEVARAFAKRDPDGNGRHDTYGFTAGGCMSCSDFWELISAFTGLTSPDEYLEDGELRGGWTSREYRAYLQFMQRLMASGALDPDLATNDFNRKRQKIVQGRIGIFHASGYPSDIIRELKANDPGAELAYLPPLRGPAGEGSHWPAVGAGNAVGITPKAAKTPGKVDKIIELMSWMSSPKGRELLLFGAEGVNHTKEKGKIRLLDSKQNDYLDVYNLLGYRSLFLNDPGVMERFYPDEGEYRTVRSMIDNGGRRGSVYSLGCAMERPNLIDELKTYREQMAARFIYGNAPLDDAGWAAYVREHDEAHNGIRVREALLSDLEKGGCPNPAGRAGTEPATSKE